jgi:electron transfer flavoprotein alpha subunit
MNMKTLVIAEHDNRKLAGATRHAVTAATLVGGEVDLLVAGSDCGAVVAEAARVAGVSRVIQVEAAFYRDQLAENLAALVVSLVQLKLYETCSPGARPGGAT